MGVVEFATSPWGQTVPIHIAFYLIWVAAIAGLAFLICHAIYVQFVAGKEAHAEPVPAAVAAGVPEKVARHSLAKSPLNASSVAASSVFAAGSSETVTLVSDVETRSTDKP